MVFFTCQHCGESLKKAAIEKHYQFKCANYPYLTCVDCLKDYKGDAYKEHTTCVTELERYSAKGFVPKSPSNKQLKKHLEWVDIANEILYTSKNLPLPQKKLLEIITKYPNIPRKRVKFHNFVNNITSRGIYKETADLVFDLLQSKLKQDSEQSGLSTSEPKEKEEKPVTNVNIDDNTNMEGQQKIKKKKKSLETSVLENDSNSSPGSIIEFNESSGKANIDDNKNMEGQQKIKKNKKSLETSVIENDSNLSTGSITEFNESSGKVLTKKERRQKRKEEKYQAELNSVQYDVETATENKKKKHKKNVNGMVDTEVDGNLPAQVNGESKTEREKKKEMKKRKRNCEQHMEIEEGTENIADNVITSPEKKRKTSSHDEIDEQLKKNKKLKAGEDIPEEETIEMVVEEPESKPTKSFNWGDKIIEILQAQDDKELPLKRLCKKTISEYCNTVVKEHKSYEQLVAKFNKKVKKTFGVRVLKDRAKLISNLQ